MDRNRFIKVLETFADDPSALDRTRSDMLVQVQSQILDFKVKQPGGEVHVTENGLTEKAEVWIRDRLANLRQLAQRIIDVTPTVTEYVSPSGQFVDVLERAPTGEEMFVESAVECLDQQMQNGVGLSAQVIYLTADAGEGKTTTIQQLARRYARDYLNRKTTSLIVPIYLGGQPFIKLDDMIIGSVANTYRFRSLYIDSFIELVKIGAIIPAFDGFEEMFVVGSSGEAVSSLANFVDHLESSGCAIVSARTAYFEIRDFAAQARLFDCMKGSEVAFSRLKLNRWDKTRFLLYWDVRCLSDGEAVWQALAGKFGCENHPLLTRAVLVSKLADIAENADHLDQLIQRIGHDASSYFAALVDSIIERELTKWLDRTEASIRKPLLTIEGHHELLSQVAVEMAISSNTEISDDELTAIAEVFCETRRFSATVSRQVVARLPDHPLLRKAPNGKKSLVFDHDEFRDFFTGEALGSFIYSDQQADYKNLLRRAILTPSAAEACFVYLKAKCPNAKKAVGFVMRCMEGEDSASGVRESSSRVLARLVTLVDGNERVRVEKCVFEPEAFRGVALSAIHFADCYFHRLDLDASRLSNCEFSACEFAAVEWDAKTSVANSVIHPDCKIYEAYDAGEDLAVFDPKTIIAAVRSAGFEVEDLAAAHWDKTGQAVTVEEDLSIAEKALRAFHRSKGAAENVFKVRLGKHYPRFIDYVVPELVGSGVLLEEKYEGKGKQRYFRLGIEMALLQKAIKDSNGDFKRFLVACQQRN